MKKYTLIALALVGTNALAENLTIISGSPLTGAPTVYAQTVASLIPGAKLVVAKDCTSAINAAKQTPNAIYITTSNQIVSANKNSLDCRVDINKDKVIAISEQHLRVCRLSTTTKTLMSPKVTLGVASVWLPKLIADDFNKNNPGASVIGIPSKGSVDLVNSLINKDIDFGMMSMSIIRPHVDSGLLTCDYDATNSVISSDRSFSTKFNLTLDEFVIKFIFANATANANDITKVKQVLTQNKDLQQFLSNGDFYRHNANITDNDIKRLNRQIDKEMQFYNR